MDHRFTQFPTGTSKKRTLEQTSRTNIGIFSHVPRRLPVQRRSPWESYQKCIMDDQGGDCIVAHAHSPSFSLVAVRSSDTTPSPTQLNKLYVCNHPNIIALKDVFLDVNLIFVYEVSYVSLKEIIACPSSPFAEFEIAAILKEVRIFFKFLSAALIRNRSLRVFSSCTAI